MDCRNMPDLVEQMYCSQQILIPPNLPSILKKYAKAAIRTQPRDLLLWSLYYFKAVANGLPPPVKDRIEYPPVETESGLTPGFLKVLIKQIGPASSVSKEVIIDKWEGICLDRHYAEILFKVGSFPEQVEWIKFVAIAAGTIEKNLTGTMSLICELLTQEPDGGSAMIPVDTFLTLYKYLAALDFGPIEEETCEKSDSTVISPETQIEYIPDASETNVETWDNLLRDIGDQKSALTIATDDLREVDSKSGLAVWPDVIPEGLQPEKVLSPQLSEEIVTSRTGIPVWDSEYLKHKTESKDEEVIDSKEESPTTIMDAQKEENEKYKEPDKQADLDDKPPTPVTEKEDGSEWTTETESQQLANEENEVLVRDPDKSTSSSEKTYEQFEEETKASHGSPESQGTEKELPQILTMLDPDSDMGILPTPAESRESLCTEGKSIQSISGSEKEPSTGQLLKRTTSLRQVNIRTKKAEEDYCPPDWAPGDKFRMYIPGIGPAIPQEIIEEVEVFLRKCSAKQSGMVMPRNLRHFLCPSLDGFCEEQYLFTEQQCLTCRKDAKKEIEKTNVPCIQDHIII